MTTETAASNALTGTDNRLLIAATPLLNTVMQIRQAITHNDPAGLRQQLIDEIRQFETRCKKENMPLDMIVGARYCLCSVIDEAAAQTPWGARGVWSGNGLLATFHNESWGGEKFFQLLTRVSQTPQQHLWLLEVIHYCLLLGYEGRFRGAQQGSQQLEQLSTRLADLIDRTRQPSSPLSGPAVDVQIRQQHVWRSPVPLWVCLTVAALIAGSLYSTLNWQLGSAAEPLLRQLYQAPLSQQPVHDASALPPLLDISQRLQDMIAAGSLKVRDDAFGSKIILPAQTLFMPDTATLNATGRATITRIARAINDINGDVLVTAYTTSRPRHFSHFASSYEYTRAQAQVIAALLNQHLQAKHRVKAQGRGDSHLLATRDDEKSRRLNQRIVITLLATPGSTHLTTMSTP